MAVHAMNGSYMIGCSVGSSCDSVMSSRWSKLFGILPVSLPAAGLYLAFVICGIVRAVSDDRELTSVAGSCMVAVAGAVLVASIWFTALQIFAVGRFCKYCMAAHSVGLVISVAVIWRWIERKTGIWLCGGLAAGVAFAALQALTAPSNVYDEGRTEEALPLVSSMNVPVIGNPDASMMIEVLYDYQCSHCRKMHGWLEKIAAENDMAFALCPSPLSPSCNPYIPKDVEDRFAGSCELTRLALAVWLAAPDKFFEYDRWLFSYSPEGESLTSSWYPRTVEEARAKAVELTGEPILESAMADPWIKSCLETTFELFGRTTEKGRGGIPRLIYGQRWIVPEADSAESLLEIIETFQ